MRREKEEEDVREMGEEEQEEEEEEGGGGGGDEEGGGGGDEGGGEREEEEVREMSEGGGMPSMRWGRCGFQSRRQGHRRSCSPRHEITPWGTPDARKIKTSPASTPMCLTYGASIAFGCDCPPGYGYRALCLFGGGEEGEAALQCTAGFRH